jgi:hypothetical protein
LILCSNKYCLSKEFNIVFLTSNKANGSCLSFRKKSKFFPFLLFFRIKRSLPLSVEVLRLSRIVNLVSPFFAASTISKLFKTYSSFQSFVCSENFNQNLMTHLYVISMFDVYLRHIQNTNNGHSKTRTIRRSASGTGQFI